MPEKKEAPKKRIVLAEPVLVWKAKAEDGSTREIPINDLDEDHLIRAHRLITRKNKYHSKSLITYKALLKALNKEVKRRKLVLPKTTEDEKA